VLSLSIGGLGLVAVPFPQGGNKLVVLVKELEIPARARLRDEGVDIRDEG
jgi:hypothetical protein